MEELQPTLWKSNLEVDKDVWLVLGCVKEDVGLYICEISSLGCGITGSELGWVGSFQT